METKVQVFIDIRFEPVPVGFDKLKVFFLIKTGSPIESVQFRSQIVIRVQSTKSLWLTMLSNVLKQE